MKLLPHQQTAVDIARRKSRWGFFYPTGCGKTLIGLTICKLHAVKTLIVAPKMLLKGAWIEDARKFYPELAQNIVNFHDVKNKRSKEKILKQAPILIINYESLLTHPKLLTNYGFVQLILDESQKIKNPKSKITKLFLKHIQEFPYIYLFSGTPAPNTEMEYYPQIKLLLGDKIDKSWYMFRLHYFQPLDKYGWKWRLKKDREQDFYNLLKSCSSTVDKESVITLHGQFFRKVEYSLDSHELDAYKQMKSDFMVEIGRKQISAFSTLTKLMKLRQILSGFIVNNGGNIVEIGKSKLKTLDRFLSIFPNDQFIIWTQYTYEAKQIQNLLGSKAGMIIGEVPMSEREQVIKDFKKGKLQFLIAHPKTIGHGMTFTNTNKAIYYSLSYSYEEFKQSQDRIYRYGQKKPCIYYILQSEQNLIDKAIYQVLQQKESNLQAILDVLKVDF